MEIGNIIKNGEAFLGIEFGSTRIKAVVTDEGGAVLSSGGYEWENRLENGVWTYSLDDVFKGLTGCYADLKKNISEQYGVLPVSFRAIGISGMMHGYMPFDGEGALLVPFRTWRNTMTGEAADILTEAFDFNIPQRWSIAHLYQAILKEEPHVPKMTYFTTLAGFIHWRLTGRKVLGVGEASGMFPIDPATHKFDKKKIAVFDGLVADKGFPWELSAILPEVLCAGENAGALTKEGAKLLDPSGDLKEGIPFCPPEGDAGTGMTATNSVAVRTGNVSAGTSVFAMIVLQNALKKVHREIDLVTTPAGDPVAMVHCNNCTSDINAWVALFREFSAAVGHPVTAGEAFDAVFRAALGGESDGGGLLAYNYYSGEHITGFTEGRPLFVRNPDSRFDLADFMRVNLFTAFGALKMGLDILSNEESVGVDKILGHGGFFKTPLVGQKILAAVMNAPVSVMETAGEGGAWGIALLAVFMATKNAGESLGDFLENRVFSHQKMSTVSPSESDVKGFEAFMVRYKAGLAIEKAAVENL